MFNRKSKIISIITFITHNIINRKTIINITPSDKEAVLPINYLINKPFEEIPCLRYNKIAEYLTFSITKYKKSLIMIFCNMSNNHIIYISISSFKPSTLIETCIILVLLFPKAKRTSLHINVIIKTDKNVKVKS